MPTTSLLVGPNVNITKTGANEAETTIAINPSNPNNLFAIDTNTYQGRYSTTGAQGPWNLSNMAGFTPSGLHDAQAVWDRFGNLFVTRLGAATVVEVGISSNGGASFSSVQTIAGSSGTDQPTLAVGPSGVVGIPGAIWVSYELGGNILASGAAVNGLGLVGAFSVPETAPGSTNGDYGSVSIGPAGQVLVNYQDGLSAGAAGAEGPGTISTNLDPDGLGPVGFNARITAHSTNVGGTASIPPQPGPFNVGIDDVAMGLRPSNNSHGQFPKGSRDRLAEALAGFVNDPGTAKKSSAARTVNKLALIVGFDPGRGGGARRDAPERSRDLGLRIRPRMRCRARRAP